MIVFRIKTPIKAYIEGASREDLALLAKQLTYTNTSISFQLSKVIKNKWLKNSNPEKYFAEINRLKQEVKNTLMFRDAGGVYIRPGSIPYIKNISFKTINEIVYPEPKLVPWKNKLPFEPYYYQKEAVEKFLQHKHGAVSYATGTGKTATIVLTAKAFGLRTVIVTPSKSIFLEMLHEFEHRFGKGLVGAFGNGKKDTGKLFTVCIAKSLSMIKEGSKEWNFFKDTQVALLDEAHTLPSVTLERFVHGILENTPYRFFFTGTHTRGDGSVALLKSITGPILQTLDTKEAIEGGFLCPLEFRIVKVPSPRPNFYRNDPISMKRFHFLRNKNLADTIAKICNASATSLNESTLVLVEELGQIKELISRLTVPFTYIHSGEGEEDDAGEVLLEKMDMTKALEDFNSGKVKVLIGTKCISTGTNIYPTHNTINWQGGSSEIMTKQGTIGRSVRKLENSKFKEKHKPKPYTKVFDFQITGDPNEMDLEPALKKLDEHLEKRIKWYKDTGCKVFS